MITEKSRVNPLQSVVAILSLFIILLLIVLYSSITATFNQLHKFRRNYCFCGQAISLVGINFSVGLREIYRAAKVFNMA